MACPSQEIPPYLILRPPKNKGRVVAITKIVQFWTIAILLVDNF